jgi:hypothetical protein
MEVWLLNAAHMKAVPGRKTDVKDAAWIAQLLRHGLLRPSFPHQATTASPDTRTFPFWQRALRTTPRRWRCRGAGGGPHLRFNLDLYRAQIGQGPRAAGGAGAAPGRRDPGGRRPSSL